MQYWGHAAAAIVTCSAAPPVDGMRKLSRLTLSERVELN
jgi:hypothetical protein